MAFFRESVLHSLVSQLCDGFKYPASSILQGIQPPFSLYWALRQLQVPGQCCCKEFNISSLTTKSAMASSTSPMAFCREAAAKPCEALQPFPILPLLAFCRECSRKLFSMKLYDSFQHLTAEQGRESSLKLFSMKLHDSFQHFPGELFFKEASSPFMSWIMCVKCVGWSLGHISVSHRQHSVGNKLTCESYRDCMKCLALSLGHTSVSHQRHSVGNKLTCESYRDCMKCLALSLGHTSVSHQRLSVGNKLTCESYRDCMKCLTLSLGHTSVSHQRLSVGNKLTCKSCRDCRKCSGQYSPGYISVPLRDNSFFLGSSLACVIWSVWSTCEVISWKISVSHQQHSVKQQERSLLGCKISWGRILSEN